MVDKKKIHLDALSKEKIEKDQILAENLWLITDPVADQTYGPFETSQLRDYINEHESEFEGLQLCNLDQEKWLPVFSFSQFQRRKPAVVQDDVKASEDTFYIKNEDGSTTGPHTQEEVASLLDNSKLRYTQEIATDEKGQYLKIYQYSVFDRRVKENMSNKDLPFTPNDNILSQVDDIKAKLKDINAAKDAVAGFAFVAHGNDKADLIHIEERKAKKDENDTSENLAEIHDFPAQEAKQSNFGKGVVAFAMMLLVGLFIYNTNMPKTSSKLAKKTPAVKENKVAKKAKAAKRAPASVSKKKPVIKKLKPKKRVARTKRKAVRKSTPRRKAAPAKVVDREERIDDYPPEEDLDINDPELQDELTRQLASEEGYDDAQMDDYQEDYPEDY